MRSLLRHRPSPALVVACIALAVALGGTSYAAITLPKNSVGTKQLKKNAVTSPKVKNGSLLRADFEPGQISGCAPGLVHSYARIKGVATTPSNYTTSPLYVDQVHNCGGGTTEVKRRSAGQYFIRFNKDPARLAVAVANFGEEGCPIGGFSNTVSVGWRDYRGPDPGTFAILIGDPNPGLGFPGVDACVTVMTF